MYLKTEVNADSSDDSARVPSDGDDTGTQIDKLSVSYNVGFDKFSDSMSQRSNLGLRAKDSNDVYDDKKHKMIRKITVVNTMLPIQNTLDLWCNKCDDEIDEGNGYYMCPICKYYLCIDCSQHRNEKEYEFEENPLLSATPLYDLKLSGL